MKHKVTLPGMHASFHKRQGQPVCRRICFTGAQDMSSGKILSGVV